jgi:hypothetical protein
VARLLLPAIALALLTIAQPAAAQEWLTRRMEFRLGDANIDFAVEVEYQDPSGVDLRLRGVPLVPVRLSIRNVSGRPLPFAASQIVLNLNGTLPLAPVDDAAVVREMEAMQARREHPALLRRLQSIVAGQSTAFHPGVYPQIRERVRDLRFRDGTLRPGEQRRGLLFFAQPPGEQPVAFNGVMWLEWGAAPYAPQLVESKSVRVRTVAAEQRSFRARFERLWSQVVLGVEPPFEKSYALLVGIGKYRHLEPLFSPARDVAKMEAFLVSQGFNEIVSIEDETVTLEMLRSPQAYFRTRIQADDRFLFYYSGHGLSRIEGGRERGYLPLVDETPNGTSRSIAMDSLVSWMQGLSARHLLVILDSCFSGLAVEGPDIDANSTRARKLDATLLNQLARGQARYLLMAGTAGQRSYADARWNGSLFTDSLIRGLRSDADAQRDRIVTARELYVWLRQAVSAEAMKVSVTLTPLLKDLGPNGVSVGDFIFVQ